MSRDTWVAQSVKHPTLDFGSGYDLMVREFEPHLELCADSVDPAWDSLSLSAPLPLTCSLCLSKQFFFFNVKNRSIGGFLQTP